MRDGYDPPEGEDGASSGLDEFLCEYVDGTMDPIVRTAFEDYLRLNPDLYEHIECLRETRSMLCRYGCRLRAPDALQQRLRERLGAEMQTPPPVLPHTADRLNWLAGVSSLVLLICGFLVAEYGMQPALAVESHTESVVEARPMTGFLVPRSASVEARASRAFDQAPVLQRRMFGRSSASYVSAPRDTFLSTVATLRPTLTSATLP